jgi:hypothetical protein
MHVRACQCEFECVFVCIDLDTHATKLALLPFYYHAFNPHRRVRQVTWRFPVFTLTGVRANESPDYRLTISPISILYVYTMPSSGVLSISHSQSVCAGSDSLSDSPSALCLCVLSVSVCSLPLSLSVSICLCSLHLSPSRNTTLFLCSSYTRVHLYLSSSHHLVSSHPCAGSTATVVNPRPTNLFLRLPTHRGSC